MRIFLLLSCAFLAAVWLMPRSIGADSTHVSPVERAQSLENALQAVEWYTNESVNKALRAEASGDLANAKLFGDKAIESDLKARGLRSDTAAAWQAAGQPSRARAAWRRAADMAVARARMLADRIPLMLQQWQAAPTNTAAAREAEILYLESLLYTAEQWALAQQFSLAAEDSKQAHAAATALQQLLQPLRQNGRMQKLTTDSQWAGGDEKRQRWQQLSTSVN